MKIAACFLDEGREPAVVMASMTGSMRLFDHQTEATYPVPGGALGHVSPGLPPAVGGWAQSEHRGNRLLISGVPTAPAGSLASVLRGVVASDYKHAAGALQSLDGVFAAVFWDALHRRLVVVTDALGVQPLYMLRAGKSLLLASELRAMCASGLVGVEADAAGWGQFFAAGNTLGNATLLAGVSRVPPATILEYDPSTGHLGSRTYWEWPDGPPDVTTIDRLPTGEIVDLLREDVRRYAALSDSSTLLLSGGFDSRILLSVLRREGLRPRSLIFAHANEAEGADGRFAMRIAREFGLAHSLVPTRPDYYSSPSYVDYLVQSEVATPSLYLFIAQLSEQIRPDMHAIWDGFFPGFSLNEAGYPADDFPSYLRHKTLSEDSAQWAAMERVFAPGVYADMRYGFRDAYRREVAAYSDDANGVWRYTFRNRGRHRIAPNPVTVYANHVLPFTPGSSRRYWEVVSRIAAPLREAHAVYFRLFREHFPEALNVPFVSQSRIASAAPWTSLRVFRRAAPALARQLLNSRLPRRYFDWTPSAIREFVVTNAEVDHPDLDRDGVRAVICSDRSDAITDAARSVLFYWQAWRWIMEGSRDRLLPQPAPGSTRVAADGCGSRRA
jgi:hypothetical protein